jgi:hypothetical protein
MACFTPDSIAVTPVGTADAASAETRHATVLIFKQTYQRVPHPQ